jgi:hypothetical protein
MVCELKHFLVVEKSGARHHISLLPRAHALLSLRVGLLAISPPRVLLCLLQLVISPA